MCDSGCCGARRPRLGDSRPWGHQRPLATRAFRSPPPRQHPRGGARRRAARRADGELGAVPLDRRGQRRAEEPSERSRSADDRDRDPARRRRRSRPERLGGPEAARRRRGGGRGARGIARRTGQDARAPRRRGHGLQGQRLRRDPHHGPLGRARPREGPRPGAGPRARHRRHDRQGAARPSGRLDPPADDLDRRGAVEIRPGPGRGHLPRARLRARGAVLGQLRREDLPGQPRRPGADPVRVREPRRAPRPGSRSSAPAATRPPTSCRSIHGTSRSPARERSTDASRR